MQTEAFNASLREVEDSYLLSVRALEAQHQAKESHSAVLEREMAAALR